MQVQTLPRSVSPAQLEALAVSRAELHSDADAGLSLAEGLGQQVVHGRPPMGA